MEFNTKIAIVVADDLPVWQKLNVVAFLTSGVMGDDDALLGDPYEDGSAQTYNRLCVQPMVILKSPREKLNTYLAETVAAYATDALPLVGIGLRADKKTTDKIFKGAKLHD